MCVFKIMSKNACAFRTTVGMSLHKTAHFPGRDHDFKIYKMKHPTFPAGLPAATTSGTTRTPRTSGWPTWSRE